VVGAGHVDLGLIGRGAFTKWLWNTQNQRGEVVPVDRRVPDDVVQPRRAMVT
jgi:hypothetical protein